MDRSIWTRKYWHIHLLIYPVSNLPYLLADISIIQPTLSTCWYIHYPTYPIYLLIYPLSNLPYLPDDISIIQPTLSTCWYIHYPTYPIYLVIYPLSNPYYLPAPEAISRAVAPSRFSLLGSADRSSRSWHAALLPPQQKLIFPNLYNFLTSVLRQNLINLSCEAEQPIWTTDLKLKIQKGFISVMQIGRQFKFIKFGLCFIKCFKNDCRKIQF